MASKGVHQMPEKPTFANQAKWLVKHVGSLHRMLPLFAAVSGHLTRGIGDEMEKFIGEHASDKVYSQDGNLEKFLLTGDRVARYRKLERRLSDSGIFTLLLPRMTIISLVSLYDAYLGRLIRVIFDVKPELLNASDRQLKFSDLVAFESIEAARNCIADLEVETILRQSHTEQFEWLEKALGVPLRKDLPAWSIFIELTERRNLFVHLDGVVNAQYLRVCARGGVKLPPECAVGSQLTVPPVYFAAACNCILEIGLKLNQVLWRKLVPTEMDKADGSLIDTSYELLVVRDFRLVEDLLRFAVKPPLKYACAENELYLKINLAIALKAQDKTQELAQLLDAIDFSALSDLFRLANSALRQDVSSAVAIMKRIGRAEKPDELAYRTWPLFRWLRQTAEFQDAFQEIFGEPLGVVRAPTKATKGSDVTLEVSQGANNQPASAEATQDKPETISEPKTET
jgi:hypothetical protein